jgi:glycosyltransferase 2 family protein
MKKMCFGVMVSALLLCFSLRGIDYIDIKKSFKDIHFPFLVQSLAFFLLVSFLKSLRWGMILSPIKKIKQKQLFPITCVGNMAIILFPFRIGEFVKPYLISNSSSIPLGSTIATIFVERILDSLCLFCLVVYMLIALDIPDWLIKAGFGFSIFCLILTIIGVFLYSNVRLKNRLFNPLAKLLSDKIYKKLKNIFQTFYEGFQIFSDSRQILFAAIITVLIWISIALGIYSLYFFQGLHLSLESAFVVLIVMAIGVSVPTAPGLLGNFQFACILALSIFNISKADAVAFSISYYIFGVGTYILLGLVFIPLTDFSLKTIKQKMF